jgi:hypothetical protein
MKKYYFNIGNSEIELILNGKEFAGIGNIKIDGIKVRSGRLPINFYTQTFTGYELVKNEFIAVEEKGDSFAIILKPYFRPLPVKLMRDHSFDPIHDTSDWDGENSVNGESIFEIILSPAFDCFENYEFEGFSYSYKYKSKNIPIFYILDRSSWEIDGNIEGATVISQSSCSTPLITFKRDTEWTTEGIIFFQDSASKYNNVMTHNLPRWASHQAFDFQFKKDITLIGVFERVELIRSLLKREKGKPELKTFDKHIFDQTYNFQTSPKKIMINKKAKTFTEQKNLWTWIIDEIHERARKEFGLKEEPLIPRISHNFWDNFVIDDYRKDLIPAAYNIGFKAIFVDNLFKSAMTEGSPHYEFHWNMCCAHEFEPAPKLGGEKRLKLFVSDCKKLGIRVYAWNNATQALSSPVNQAERDERNWFIKMEDTRLKYGGAYTSVMSFLNLKNEEARNYWVNSLKKVKDITGLDAYLLDSFYNAEFMPVNYSGLEPKTQWRELLIAMKELQDYGISFLIESFGPFGSPQHGCPTSYGERENIFTCYKMTVGLGYTTIPSGTKMEFKEEADIIYYFFAHMASPSFPLFINRKRIDLIWTEKHKSALRDYNNNWIFMRKRYLQEDDGSVLWYDKEGKRITLWNFRKKEFKFDGKIIDLTEEKEIIKKEGKIKLEPFHTYLLITKKKIGGAL